jgi:dTDP-4-amino-4,6-dideoxygalactose transaminase
MIVTSDATRAERLRCLRGHGAKPKYHHRIIGGNFRLDAIQAAVVSAKLPHLDAWTAARQANARRYDRLLAGDVPGAGAMSSIGLPAVRTDRHIFNQYVIRTPRRDELQASLKQQGVGTEVYYPIPMHQQECFAHLGYTVGAFPESERAALETLALPVHPELSEAEARYVVDCVREAMAVDCTSELLQAAL